MKRLLSFASKVLAVAVVLLALAAPVSASKPEEVVFTFDLVITVPDAAAEGRFVATGAIEDSGTVDETFRWTDEGILQGTMVLTSAEGTGTITLRFHLELLPIIGPPPVVPTVGRFVVVSGTGAYENIHGVGSAESNTYLGTPPTIDATFDGQVHVDP